MNITHHPSPITHHTSHITHHTSHITHHTSHINARVTASIILMYFGHFGAHVLCIRAIYDGYASDGIKEFCCSELLHSVVKE
ncbi:MAG: hypothetical protein IT497_06150 [Ottowia sp.]|nr:hypothetical protein [Ottowia sp.]